MSAPALQLAPRLPDWRVRLTDYLAEVARHPLRPGRHDCALFVAGAVRAMTGSDPARGWRGKYRSLAAGQRALEARGYADHVALVAAWCPPVAPAFAAVGDIAVMKSDVDAAALGLVQGASVYVLSRTGLVLVSRMEMLGAFKI